MHRAILNEKREVVPCEDLTAWASWWENIENRRVDHTVIERRGKLVIEVYTTFLGTDYGFGGPALWFESLVCGGLLDGSAERYATWDAAVRGHAELVDRVRDTERTRN